MHGSGLHQLSLMMRIKVQVTSDSGSDKDILDALTFTASTNHSKELFASNYQGINRCNQALKYLPQLDKSRPQLRERLAGEAKF